MKTKNVLSLLSLALIFAVATSAFAGGIAIKGGGTANSSIRFTVNVNYSGPEQPLLASYELQIYNERHQMVAPPQMLMPGKTQYTFFERGPADGVRIAVLVKSLIDNAEPWWSFVAEPCAVKGPFEIGQNYRFDLYPTLQGGEKE